MSKILDNKTGAPIVISDTGVTVDNVTDYTIPSQDYLLWAASDDIITEIGAGNIVVNNGSNDLGKSEGIDLLKGVYHGVALTDNVHGKNLTYTAFGGLKTAAETIIGDFRFDAESIRRNFDIEYHNNGKWDIESSGTGARIVADELDDGLHLHSKEKLYYQAGRGIMLKQSIITDDAGVAGCTREWGLNDEDTENGVFLRLDGTTLSWIIKSNGSETVILASNWDIPITHDGNGHIWYIQFEWLGVGNMYLYQDETLVHTYNFIGTSKEFSIGSPDLKVYYSIHNYTNTTPVYMKFGCASVISEGGANARRLDQFPDANDVATLTQAALIGRSEDGHYHQGAMTEVGELLVYNKMQLEQFTELITCLREIKEEINHMKITMGFIFNHEPKEAKDE